jgi:phage baseplate assembly protein W
MAFNVRRINPLDLQPRKAVGVALPFQGRAVFNSTYTTKDATRTNLINFFLTAQNERVFNPRFGSGIRNLLFENLTQESIDIATENITQGLQIYFPQVEIRNLQLVPIYDENLVNFELKYAIRETGITDELTINFEL